MLKASRTIGAIALLAGLVWWVTSLDAFRGDSWRSLLQPEMVLPCGAFLIFSVTAWLLRGVRWALFLNDANPSRWPRYITAYGIGFALGAVTPARSGDLLRITLTGKLGHSYTRITGAYIIERVSDLLLLFFILFLGVSLGSFPLQAGLDTWGAIIALILLVLYLLLGGIAVWLERTKLWKWVTSFERLSAHAAELRAGFQALAGHRNHARLTLLGLFVWALHIAATTSFLMIVFPGLPIVAGLLFLTLTNLSGLLQLTPGNVGPYEAVGMLVLERFGIAASDALAMTAGLHAFSLLSLSAYGGLCYLARSAGSNGPVAVPSPHD